MNATRIIELEIERKTLELKAQIKALENEIDALEEVGRVGDAKWAVNAYSQSFVKLKNCVLFPFRKELEGEYVYYPKKSGAKWLFNKAKMNKWVYKNFENIDWSK